MSVREVLLALLLDGPRHGYQLRGEHDDATASPRPLNVGQVYATLDRLARDGLVEPAADPAESVDDRRRTWQATEAGGAEATAWFVEPAAPGPRRRQELVEKVLLAARVEGAPPVDDVVQRQRAHLVEQLQQVRIRQRDAEGLAEELVSDAAAMELESALVWLDRCTERLAARRREHREEP